MKTAQATARASPAARNSQCTWPALECPEWARAGDAATNAEKIRADLANFIIISRKDYEKQVPTGEKARTLAFRDSSTGIGPLTGSTAPE